MREEGQPQLRTCETGMLRDALGGRTGTRFDGREVVQHELDPVGRELRRLLSGGAAVENGYDPLGRLVERRVRGITKAAFTGLEPEWVGQRREGIIAEKRYAYDASGELTNTWDMARGSTQYTYDPVGQLLAAVPEKARAEVFAYDPTGNVNERDDAEKRAYGPGNRLVRKGATEYEWDGDGRLVAKRLGSDVTEYDWNGAGLLQSVPLPDGRQVEFAYDTFARRVGKRVTKPTEGGKVALESQTHFWWDGDVLVHAIRERAKDNGDPIVEERTFAFEDDSFVPMAHRDGASGGEWFSYVNDPIGKQVEIRIVP